MSTHQTPGGESFDQFPGFKIPPNDPSREVKRTGFIAQPAPEDKIRDYNDDDDDDPYCDHCDNWGYIDCRCGGDLCVCGYNGEIPCPYCL